MHLPFRRLLLIVATVAFIAIAPLIVLYAVGYRPITTTTPQPVGVVIVNSFPRKANVLVNGTAYGTTPRSIPNLLPGIADVQVTKDGYQPWQKKLDIKPIQATDARAITLLPTSPDQDIVSDAATMFSVSPDASTIAIATANNQVFITDANGKFKTNLIAVKSAITSLLWSPDSTYVFASTKNNGNIVLHFSNQTIEKVPSSIPADFQNGMWDSSTANALLGMSKKNQLVRYIISDQALTVINPSINNYTQLESEIIVQRTDNTLEKAKATIDINKRVHSFIASPHGDLAMILDSGELKVLQKDNSLLPIAEHVVSASWSPDGLMLLVQTSANELNIYNVSNTQIVRTIPFHELHLLTRLSTPIQHAQWLPDSSHIIYETEGNIIFSETDPRDHAITNSITAAPRSTGSSTWISKDGTSLIHLQEHASQASLVRTWLVTKEDR